MATVIFVRWQRDEPRLGRVFEPFDPVEAGEAIHEVCPECLDQMGIERRTRLLIIGPTDEDDRLKHEAGRWYSAGAVLLHEDCAATCAAELLAAQMMVVRDAEPRT